MAVATVATSAATGMSGPHTAVRSSELNRAVRAFRGVGEGRGAVVELTGEPGSGKTWLLTALAREAERQGVTVLRGRGSEGCSTVPFYPFIEAFSTWQPNGPVSGAGTWSADLIRTLANAPADTGADGFTRRCHFFAELRRQLVGCLEAAPGGLLLLLDDFHWADPGSVEVLDMLVRRPLDAALSLAVAYRPRQAPVALRAAIQQGAESGTVEALCLGPLTLHQSAHLLGVHPSTPGLAELHQQSEGSPLYLGALAEADDTAGDSPDRWARSGLGARLLAETAALNQDQRRAAHAAAVLGHTFSVDAVAAVALLGRDDACRALGQLIQRDLVRSETGGLVAFRHPLLGACLYGEADSCWRAGAHRRALAHLAALGSPPLELAPHAERSGDQNRPSDGVVFMAAAEAARLAGQLPTSVRWLTAALRSRRTAGDAEGAVPVGPDAWKPVVRALAAAGDILRIRALAREILATPGTDGPDHASAVVFLATVEATLGHVDEAQSLIATELDRSRDADPAVEALLHLQYQLVKVLAGSVPARADVEALVRQNEHADPVTRAGVAALRALCAVIVADACAASQALDEADSSLAEISAQGSDGTGPEACYLLMLGWAEGLMGRYQGGHAHVSRALGAARENGDAHLLPPLLVTLSFIAYQSGRTAEAIEAAQEAGTTALAAGRADHAVFAQAVATAAWVQLGRSPSSGWALPDGVLADVPRTTLTVLLLAEAAMAAGDGEATMELLLPEREAWRVSEPVPVFGARVYELLAAASALMGEDPTPWAERAVDAAASVGLSEQGGHALLARGHVLGSRLRTAEAARCYDDAFELLGDGPSGNRARDLARSARSAGPGQSEAQTQSGAAPLVELTLREREVARLAGQGLKTKEIAERLHVSPRTVDAHLSRIYHKLGVNSRVALVRLVTSGD
ncbi:AAA family ATPase [Streptacidiphilus sp. EB103A]|uniref:helix-turn-helix transcriptional regulator n=1 Tax=Streptacidiphilus sp. EB103A TaxID=3156275 RepID=UPI0035178F63